MWGDPYRINDDCDWHVIFLDFEGFASTHRGLDKNTSKVKSTIDSKLFALCVLLSSSICYNIESTFDEKTLMNLDVIKDFENYIKIRMPTVSSNLVRNKELGEYEGRGTVVVEDE
jgi:hypothetical protein